MHTLNSQSLKALAELATPPCLSVYQSTHRSHPDNQQDRMVFRGHVKSLVASLAQAHVGADVPALLAPFHALADNDAFWNHTLDGLAVLGCNGAFQVFVLARNLPDIAVVADSFHTQPLRRTLQSVDRYQVLCLSRDKAKLWEGNRDGLVEIEMPKSVPGTATEALGDRFTEPHQTVSSMGGIGQGTSPLVHSSGGKKDEVDLDADRYFRLLDRAVTEHCSKPSGLPLLLVALPEHHHRFRQASHNNLLMAEGLEINPDALDPQTLCERAWALMEPPYRAKQAAWAEAFMAARAKGLGSDELNVVAQAAVQGRVSVLLLEDGRLIPGRLQPDSGRVAHADLQNPTVDDMLDDLGELVERMGGEVHALPALQMPTTSGLAATFRH